MSDSVLQHIVSLKLPYPISANRYWRKVPMKGKRGNREIIIVSDEGVAYKNEVGWRLKAYGLQQPIQGRVMVGVQLYPARPQDADKRIARDPLTWDDTVRCIDLDNSRKVLYDALKGIAFVDDNKVFADWAVRMEPVGDAHVIVHIKSFARESNPQAQMEGFF